MRLIGQYVCTKKKIRQLIIYGSNGLVTLGDRLPQI